MRTWKKTMALLLAAMMTLAMGITSIAANQTGKLTVKVNEGNTLKGQTLHLYRLFDLTVSGSGDTAKYGYTLNEKYKEILKDLLFANDPDADTKSNAEYYQAVADLENAPAVGEQTAVQDFANRFTEETLTTGASASDAASGKIDAETDSYAFEDLDYGYYLVYQTGTKVLQSSLVSVDQAEVRVDLKGQAPAVVKTADKASAEIGEVITYTIEGTVPDTTGYQEYTYQLHDKLTDGLDFVLEDGTAVSGASYDVTVQIGSGTAETKAAVLSGDGSREMELDLSSWVRDNQASRGETFTVTYYAKVNADAVVETKNSAYLEYGNQPDDTTASVPSEAVTSTYPLSIRKTDADGVILEGAVFRLYKDEADAQAGNDDAMKVSGQDGVYTVAGDQAAETNMDMATAAAETEGRNLYLNGLAAGTYWLVETQAPDGYNKLAAPVKVTITKDAQNELEWAVEKNDVDEADKVIDIENTTGTILPGTGGIGTAIFTLIAAVLILGVTVSFVKSRKHAA